MGVNQDVNEIEVMSENENSLNNNNNNSDAAEQYVYFRENPKPLNIEVDIKIEEAPQYSNVPSISPSSNVPIILKNAASDHVYSNIDETVTLSYSGTGNRFMSDTIELDLDDPLLTSSFIKNNQPQNVYDASSSSAHEGQSSKMMIPSISISSSSSTGTQVTSIELKNVLNAFQRQETMIDSPLSLDI